MINRNNKKGFTIVELVIVIAVIAILAAVLIPTFSGIIAKANLSADQQAIRNMNTALATYTDSNKEISDIMAHLRSNGFSYEKMVTYSKGFHYCYAKTTNQMYLLDKDNNVIYPENATVAKSDLWAAYGNHGTYMIDGLTNYYAICAVTSQEEFNTSFKDGTNYVLDLNGNVCTVEGKTNVTVKNGSATKGGFASSSTVISVSEMNADNTKVDSAAKKTTYTNVLNPAGVGSNPNTTYTDGYTVEYVNCVFTRHTGFYQNEGNALNLIFKNCTFVDIDSFGLTLQPVGDTVSGVKVPLADRNNSTVLMDGCEFINCNRGININGWEKTTVTIKNTNFALKTGNSAYNCVQISSYANDEELATLKVDFTNNTVASANGVVYFHDSMTGPQDLNNFKGTLNFSGNTYAEGVSKIADRNEYKEGHLLYKNADAMKALEELIK